MDNIHASINEPTNHKRGFILPPLSEITPDADSTRSRSSGRDSKKRRPKPPAEDIPMRLEGGSLIPWDPPIPLDPTYGPEFPPDLLPLKTAEYIRAVAESYQVPLGMPAVMMLGVASIAVTGKFEIAIGDWVEPIHGHFVVAAEPGEMKSAVHRELSSVLNAWEAERNEQELPLVSEWESRHRALKQALTRAENATNKPTGDGQLAHAAERVTALQELQEHEANRKVLTTLIVDNSTPEAASELLFLNGGSLGVSSAEGTFIESQLFGYKPQPDIELLLKGHAGDPMKTTRRSSEGGSTPRACLSLSICLQPHAIQDAGKVKGFTGKGAAGRFLIAFPKSMAGYRDVLNSPSVPEHLRAEWQANIRVLLDIPRAEEAVRLNVSDEALLILRRFLVQHEQSRRGLTGGFAGWVSKQRGAVLRLAGLIHLLDSSPGEPVSPRTMASAVLISAWFREHAKVMFRLLSDDTSQTDAQELLEWLLEKQYSLASTDGWIHMRSIHQGLRGRSKFRDAKAVRSALDTLDLHNYVEVIERKGEIGRPSTLVSIRPETDSQYSQDEVSNHLDDEWRSDWLEQLDLSRYFEYDEYDEYEDGD